jgi:mRNA interferase MazF
MVPISTTTKVSPNRGEIWDVDLEPTKGAEMKKVRPVIVVSSDALRSLPLRLVAPITGWQEKFSGKFSHVHLEPQKNNGLKKDSAVDTLQLRGLSVERFKNKRGIVSANDMEEITCAIAAVVEYR